jgi:diguanylate cyclase (GGDEF)-like protein
MSKQYDSLTNLLTKKTFFEYLEETLQKHSDTNIAMALMDIDMFKEFNDKEGHLMGDEIIKQIAEILKSNARPGELIGRYGGTNLFYFSRYNFRNGSSFFWKKYVKMIA